MFLDDIAWIIQKATDHLKTLSSAEKTDVAESEADFNQNYGRAGLKLAHADVCGLLISVFHKFSPTSALVQVIAVQKRGPNAPTALWNDIWLAMAPTSASSVTAL